MTTLGVQTLEGGASGLVFLSDDALNLRDNVAQTFISIAASAQSIGPAAVAPDGNSIIFDARVDGYQRLFRWDRASGTARPFVHAKGDQYHPAWSQDGTRILYVSTQDGNAELYQVDAAGSRPERLTNDPAEDDYPSWGPDGKQIVWESLRGGRWQILLETLDGRRRLGQPVEGGDDRYPRLSPDGTQLVFASNRDRPDGELDLYLQTLPDGTPRRLTQLSAGSANGPQWSPDGTMIVYFANPAGNDDVYFVPAAGGESTRLTNGPANDRWPMWSR
jgi:tol-pal system beta propeller repeat protein TolB